MTFMKLTILCAAIGSLICGCNGGSPEPIQPNPDEKLGIVMTQKSATDNSVVVDVTLTNADTAYAHSAEL